MCSRIAVLDVIEKEEYTMKFKMFVSTAFAALAFEALAFGAFVFEALPF